MTVIALETAKEVQRSEPVLDRLLRDYGRLDGTDLLRPLIEKEFAGRIAIASSFGTEAAVTLALVAEVDPSTPVLFLDTGFLFPETLAYRQALQKRLGLTDIRNYGPEDAGLDVANPTHALWNTAACCHLRKVLPMERALKGFDAWITGRKQIHGAGRAALPAIEFDEGRYKINPLASWDRSRIEAFFRERDLPHHPLEAQGYPSVGCFPCTAKAAAGDDARAGRWAGSDKTECGIHKAKWYRAGENI
jgi:phosphoadenosine phosphosulfate reductase